MKPNWKVIGYLAVAGTALLTAVGNLADMKGRKEETREMVEEVLAERENKKEEEESN